jgi:CBS domain-containing protein
MPDPTPRPAPWDSPTGAHPEPVPLVSQADLVNPLLKVSDVMSADPRTCSPYSTVIEAVLIFRDADCGVIPVTEDGKPVGVLTDRDVALALADLEDDLAGAAVGEIMSKDVVTIEEDESLEVAVDRLGGEGLRRLLVVASSGSLRGILSWIDLVPHLSERGVGHVVSRIIAHR